MMAEFRLFPWRYITDVLDSRESFFNSSIEFTKEEFADRATPCPECGQEPSDLTWVPVDTANETWERGEGQTGFVTCCMQCKIQVNFFVDDELTRLEAELRATGQSSQDMPWSETEPVE